jgi:tRNA threonylcarbamoyladenosine biosynthesis protein TsaB
VIVLGLDTATADTAVAAVADGELLFEASVAPAEAGRPQHATRLLPEIDRAAAAAGGWQSLDLIAVGVGPGSFTGLRIGIATARALAGGSGLSLRPVSSLAALAQGIEGELRLPLIDARRGELFAALYGAGEVPLWPPFVAAPEQVAERVREADLRVRAAGDGSIRFRGVLEAAGIGVEADESRAHVVRALHVCRLARTVPGEPPEAVLPEYLRTPDVKPQ